MLMLIEVARLCIWLVLLAAIFVPLERLFARRKQRVFRKQFGVDVAYYFLSSLLPKLVLVVPFSLLSGLLHRYASIDYYFWVGELPAWIRVSAALVVMETGTYWGHRWSHQIPLLWRFHAVHHGAEEIDWLVSTRAHPVDMIFTRICGMIPMYLLGLAQPTGERVDLTPVLLTIVGTIWGFLIHANLNLRLGWIEWLVATPAFHHWHHNNDGPAVLGKNFAATLPWMDRVFGTFHLPGEWPEKYGIDEALPETFGGQLLGPLTAANTQRTNPAMSTK